MSDIGKMKIRIRDRGAKLIKIGVEQFLVASLFLDDTVLLAKSEGTAKSCG